MFFKERLRHLPAQIHMFVCISSSLIIEIVFYVPGPPHKRLEHVYHHLFLCLASLPPLDDFLETEAHLMFVSQHLTECLIQRRHLISVSGINEWNWSPFLPSPRI